MKKVLLLLFVCLLSLVLIACNGGQGGGNEGGGSTEDGGSTEGGNDTQGGGNTEGGDNTQGGGSTEGGDNTQGGGNTEGGDSTQGGGSTEGGDNTQGGGSTEGGDNTQGGGNTEGGDSTTTTFTVSFVSNGGSAVPSQTVASGSLATCPEKPSYKNHRFVGWFTDASLQTPADFSKPITAPTTFYAAWNETVDIVAYLRTLLSGYTLNPYKYVPEAMRPDYAANLVSPSDVSPDYSSFVNVSAIESHGFGEQWNMVLENISQSSVFFNALSVVETVASSSITIFNNYIDKNPADTAHHAFANGIYNVTVDFDGRILYYVLDYTATFPVIGEASAQIALAMDITTGIKTVRIQLGDANALTYVMTPNSYEFAIKYLGVRRAYFSMQQAANGDVTGHIYEYLTVSSVEVASAADFYITDSYVTAVGNKADGMIGFKGYISEVYKTATGKLLGYEVREEMTILGKTATYNTLWFDLDMISGINSIKYIPATTTEGANGEEETTPAMLYINGSSTAWETVSFGGIGAKMFSRRFDIEFRTQYFYSYDSAKDEYVQHAVQVPMLFVQEEKYSDLAKDVKDANGVTVSVAVNAADLNKIQSDYDTCVDVFILNKDLFTVDNILAFIGAKVDFDEP